MRRTSETHRRPIRVVMFGGGPVLEEDVVRFLGRLEEHRQIELVGVFCQSPGQGFDQVAADLWRRRKLLALPLLALQLGERVARLLFRPGADRKSKQVLIGLGDRLHYVPRVHDKVVLDAVRALEADLGLSYGSPILKEKLFALPRLGTLGIHHGKVPAYRGKKTTFWAMYNGEKTAGVTIQKINAGLDTGQIVRAGEVTIGRRTRRQVWRDLVALGLDLYIEAILDMGTGEADLRPQEGAKGALYRDPTLKQLVIFQWKSVKRRLGF